MQNKSTWQSCFSFAWYFIAYERALWLGRNAPCVPLWLTHKKLKISSNVAKINLKIFRKVADFSHKLPKCCSYIPKVEPFTKYPMLRHVNQRIKYDRVMLQLSSDA